MPFDSGTISCRVCHLPQPLPDDALERFSKKAAPSLESVKDEAVWGWVSGRHLLERRIDEETAYLGGYLHLCLRQAQRKIPTSLLRAECRMLELAEMAAKETTELSRKDRKRIREEVTERLLPKMPPQLSGISFVVDMADSRVYVGATSDKQLDIFLGYFCDTIGFEPVPLTPEVTPMDIFKLDPDAVAPLNFSPELPDGASEGTLGQNFLTWVWFYQETTDGALPKSQLGEFHMLVDGPLTFVAEGPGAHESAIRKGLPTISAEAKAALVVGKKLKRAKLIISRGKGETWTFTIDADTFAIRGLKLPQGEALDAHGAFEERMTNLYVIQTVFYALYQRYLKQCADSATFTDIQKKVKAWVAEMDGK